MTNRRSESDPGLDELVDAAKGLAHPARLRLLAMLVEGELCVCQMIAVLGLAPSTVSQHLAVLSRGGLVEERKDGRWVYYSLRESGPAAALRPLFAAAPASDPVIAADRKILGRLRRVPVATLCAADLDLQAIGVRAAARPSSPAAARPVAARRTRAARGGTKARATGRRPSAR